MNKKYKASFWMVIKHNFRSLYSRFVKKLLTYAEPDTDLMAREWKKYGVKIGANVHIDPTCFLDKSYAELLEIRDNVVIAMGTSFILHDSSFNNVIGEPLKMGRIIIDEGTYIGANSTILLGVKIGKSVIIGACSLVNKDIPDGMVAYGQPIKIVGEVEALAQDFYTIPDLKKDMVVMQKFPSQKEKKNLSRVVLKHISVKSKEDASAWLTNKRNNE